jgi:hypothetical protein
MTERLLSQLEFDHVLQKKYDEMKDTTSAQTGFSSTGPDQVHQLTNKVSDLESELLLLKESSQANIKLLKSKILGLTQLLEALHNTLALGPQKP